MSDEIFQGFFIGAISLIGLSIGVWCFKKCRTEKPTMKKSPSTEELSSVSTEDPSI